MRVWLLVIALAACEKRKPAPVSPDRDLLLSALAADMVAFATQANGIALDFNGDCAAHANQLLTLEPLVASLRTRAADLTAEETRNVGSRIAARKGGILAAIDVQLAERHLTREQGDAKEAQVQAACANDPKVKDAMDRVSIYKKP
jgi:hypothetical protein